MSNHTMLTIGAFILLTTILVSFYRLLGTTGDDISNSQDLILATTIATSYIERAQGLSYDETTDSTSNAIGNASLLTKANKLGPEAGEDSVELYNDFDDFNGLMIQKSAPGGQKRFITAFTVRYVDPDDYNAVKTSQTFVKRLDLKTWRSFPMPSLEERLDTLHLSIGLGYFHFD